MSASANLLGRYNRNFFFSFCKSAERHFKHSVVLCVLVEPQQYNINLKMWMFIGKSSLQKNNHQFTYLEIVWASLSCVPECYHGNTGHRSEFVFGVSR